MSPKKATVFSDEELAAMKDYIAEKKTTTRRSSRPSKEEEENTVLARIAEFEEPDRAMAERIHALVKAAAPELTPRLWYGMPAYALESKVICFFQPAAKFKTRYATLGFNDSAHLDDGAMWPVAFALTGLTAAVEAKIGALVKKAAA